MSDLQLDTAKKQSASLWQAALLILAVVFVPAALMWAIGMVHP
ncbi:MAG TPA: hypothetical protein VHM90_17515 [Phycisphaerae bacterium]|nr:hypothetical protein [Phycisphaerae bacterium]